MPEAHRGQKRYQNPPGIGVTEGNKSPYGVLKPNPGSHAVTASTLNYWATPPAPYITDLIRVP